jgi:hypothetical protein
MMSWSLARKVSAALIAILMVTMVTTALFGYYKFEDVMSSLVRSRYSFVIFTIKKKVEDSLNLGFAIRQLRQVQDTIEVEKARDEQVLSIEVYDSRGEVLFSTDRGGIGATVPEKWLEMLGGSAATAFSLMDEDTNVVGLPLVNNLGKVEGAVVLRYPVAFMDRGLVEVLGQLVIELLVVMAVFGALGVAGTYFVLGQVRRKLGAMETTLTRVLAEGGEALPDRTGAGADFETRFAEFVGKTREAADHIRDSAQEVERLDRLA